MDLHVDDDGYVRAPAALVYRQLTDVGRWTGWWPGMRALPLAAPGEDERWALEMQRSPRHTLRVAARPHQWRHDAGFRLDLSGDLDGWSEFWLEPGWGGTVVHHLLVASTADPQPMRVLADYRAVLRAGLWELKDTLQRTVREAAGLTP